MLITRVPLSLKDGDLKLRPFRVTDGLYLSRLLAQEDILNSSSVDIPRKPLWFLLYWWIRRTFPVAYCVERQAKVIGFIGLYNLAAGRSSEITLVLFDPVFRRRGFGTLAFNLLSRNSFTKAFANTFIARVRKDNEPALFFWRKLGFKTVRSDKDTMVMELRGEK